MDKGYYDVIVKCIKIPYRSQSTIKMDKGYYFNNNILIDVSRGRNPQ